MNKFKVCATTANLGIGFDSIGLALDLYNEFEVELSDTFITLDDNDVQLNNDNLFEVAYKKASQYKNTNEACKCKIHTGIPRSGGLGTSATVIVAGIYAYSLLHNNCLNKEEILKLATEIEGHPDNVAPAIYGNMCIIKDDTLLNLKVDDQYYFGLWIQDARVSTEEARKILPNSYSRNDVVNNVASALIGVNALTNYNEENIKLLMNDKIHEPYRSTLIPHFNEMKEYALNNGALCFLISGSGSTCLSISNKPLNINFKDIKYIEVKVNKEGIID